MTGCPATAADPTKLGRILTCANPNAVHEGTAHHATDHDGHLHTWGAPGKPREPSPDPDFFAAYLTGDPIQIAAARGRYSDKLAAAGFPPLTEPIDWTNR